MRVVLAIGAAALVLLAFGVPSYSAIADDTIFGAEGEATLTIQEYLLVQQYLTNKELVEVLNVDDNDMLEIRYHITGKAENSPVFALLQAQPYKDDELHNLPVASGIATMLLGVGVAALCTQAIMSRSEDE